MSTGLFEQTLQGDYDDESYWQAVRALHQLGTREVLDQALEWSTAADPLKRARAADILGQLGRVTTNGEPFYPYPAETLAVLMAMTATETDPRPLASAIYAAGHFGHSAVIPHAAAHKSHSGPGVRHAVAFTMGCFANDPTAIEVLLFLMNDSESDVRDWATFGLGSVSAADSLEIRDALRARLTDSDEATREEAGWGLGKRQEPGFSPFDQSDSQ
jgi:HEAT repeat protein